MSVRTAQHIQESITNLGKRLQSEFEELRALDRIPPADLASAVRRRHGYHTDERCRVCALANAIHDLSEKTSFDPFAACASEFPGLRASIADSLERWSPPSYLESIITFGDELDGLNDLDSLRDLLTQSVASLDRLLVVVADRVARERARKKKRKTTPSGDILRATHRLHEAGFGVTAIADLIADGHREKDKPRRVRRVQQRVKKLDRADLELVREKVSSAPAGHGRSAWLYEFISSHPHDPVSDAVRRLTRSVKPSIKDIGNVLADRARRAPAT